MQVDQSSSGTPLVKRQGLEKAETSTSVPSFYLLVVFPNPLVFLRKPGQLRETDSVVSALLPPS